MNKDLIIETLRIAVRMEGGLVFSDGAEYPIEKGFNIHGMKPESGVVLDFGYSDIAKFPMKSTDEIDSTADLIAEAIKKFYSTF